MINNSLKFAAITMAGSLIALAVPLHVAAQPLPDVNPAIQSAVDRQAERAQEQAAERAQGQAAERAQGQAAERAQGQAAERVQGQAAERAQGQAAERVQGQAAERAQGQAAERAQGQAAERAQDQAAERAQGQAAERAQGQAAERAQGQAAERAQDQAAERAQGQAAERAQGQAAERAQGQAAERAEGQAVERAQNQAAERAQGEQGGRLPSQAASRAQEQIERLQSQTAERTQGQAGSIPSSVERLQGQSERAQSQASAQARSQTGQLQSQAVERTQNPPGRGRQQNLDVSERLAEQDRPGDVENESNRRSEGSSGSEERSAAAPAAGPGRAARAAFREITVEPYVRAIEFEWVMLLSEAQRQQLDAEAPQLLVFLAEAQAFSAIDSELLTFRVPPDLDTDEAILQLVPEELRHLIDRNHVYSIQSEPLPQPNPEERSALSVPLSPVCEDSLSIGLIDSAINLDHAAFAGMAGRDARIIKQNFVDAEIAQPSGHGTAIAGLLVGEGDSLRPLLPGASLYSASVVYSEETSHQGTTLVYLLQALDWLMRQDLQVINMSLSGPPNRLLFQMIEAVTAQGKVIVAAAGNEGPHAPPQYPAAYERVISATAVASDYSVYRWANQGDYIDFSALGVAVPTAQGDGGFGKESGTSIATAIVSAFLACALLSSTDSEEAMSRLLARAIDLGEPGFDPVFGYGLLHP